MDLEDIMLSEISQKWESWVVLLLGGAQSHRIIETALEWWLPGTDGWRGGELFDEGRTAVLPGEKSSGDWWHNGVSAVSTTELCV